MRPIGKLSAVSLSRLAKTAGLHGDGGGLYLASDGKQQCSWVYRYMIGGRARTMGLGPYPDIPLADARRLAGAARGLRAQTRSNSAISIALPRAWRPPRR